MSIARLALIPRDGIFCKDGRGWYTSASERGCGLDWPWPSTVLGALRTAWGRDEERKTGTTFSADDWRKQTAGLAMERMLALRRPLGASWTAAHRIWPVPSDALWRDGCDEVRRLDPLQPRLPTLSRDDDDARESLWVPVIDDEDRPLPSPRWWSDGCFIAWLRGSSVRTRDSENAFDLSRRIQVHVGINADTCTVEEGKLYSHEVMETLERDAEWAIGAELRSPSGDVPSMATLGADRRFVCVEELPAEVFEPPATLLDAFRSQSLGLRLVVVTPACFERGWLLDGFAPRGRAYHGRLPRVDTELVLRAALVGTPVHVSGWDMVAGTPKPTSRMVPTGAVYFFERVDGRPFGEAEAGALWLASLGARTNEGFGQVVPATWSPKRKEG